VKPNRDNAIVESVIMLLILITMIWIAIDPPSKGGMFH
jgi:hypothetical protein